MPSMTSTGVDADQADRNLDWPPPPRPLLDPAWPPPSPPRRLDPTWPPPAAATDPALDWPPPRRRRPRVRRVIEAAAVLAIVATALAFDRSPLVIGAVVFVLVVPFEKLFPRHRGQRIRRPHLRTDLAYLLAGPVLNVLGLWVAVVVGVVSLFWIPGLALRPLVALIPAAALPVAGVLAFDLAVYWVHRWSHEVPFLWRFHAVHHSTEHLDWVSGFRAHPFDGALLAPPFVFLLAAGFRPELAGVFVVVQIVTGLFLHANVRWRLRPLQRIVITPEFHHWHHTNDPRAIHSNYSVFLPVWDQVFGTYYVPADRRPDRYGIDEYMPAGMVAQLRWPLRGAGNPVRAVRRPWSAAKGLLRFVRQLVGQIVRSTTRRRNGSPLPTVSSGG